MPRPTRLQYENAFYHVMNRGRGRRTIFHDERYYEAFLDTLAEAHQRFDAVIHAYCLMGNHYHLLIETPSGNLDRIMRHINGVYTQRHNRLKRTDGPLFRGRYKAIVVDKDAYLLQLSRYIHRNPIEVKGAPGDALETYLWSSYRAYINKATPLPWLERNLTYQMLGHHQRYVGYRSYVEAGIDEDIKRFYSKGNIATILGGMDFKETLLDIKEGQADTINKVERMSEKPSPDIIVKAVALEFKTKSIETIKRKQTGRQKENRARRAAIYCCHHFANMTRREIASYFGFKNPGSTSSSVELVRREIDEGGFPEVERIRGRLNMTKLT